MTRKNKKPKTIDLGKKVHEFVDMVREVDAGGTPPPMSEDEQDAVNLLASMFNGTFEQVLEKKRQKMLVRNNRDE